MLQVLLTGLSTGAIYGLVAMGFAVVFYVTRVINFATGQLLMVAIMITAGLATLGWPIAASIVVGLAASTLGGVVIYFLAVRPVLRFDRLSFAWLVSTLGVAIILESAAALIWGTSSLSFPQMLNGNDVKIASAALTWQQIVTVLIAIGVVVAFEAFRTRTLFGKIGMAISSDPEIAAATGANVTAYAVLTFALGGLLAGVAGELVGPISFANPYLGDSYGIYGFIALMIGGIERPAASMGGGLVLGILSTIASTYINPQASEWFPFVVVLAVLLLTPKGVFLSGEALRNGLARVTTRRTPRVGGVVSAVVSARGRPGFGRLVTVGVLVVYVAATVVLGHSSNYQQGLLLVAAVFAMLAVSLDLVAGATGLYSLGHAGLFAIGAYGTTILSTTYGWNVFLALPVAVAAAGAVGIVIGALSLRVSGLYFAITTLIFTIIVNVLLSNLTITGGYQGLSSPTFPSFPHALSHLGTALVWAVSGALLLTVALVWSIRASALYPVLLAIRDSEPFASSAGVRTAMTKVWIFGLSAAIAGLAGWTFSFLGFITPGQFNATASINILVMVILGGINTRLGPICGAVFISLFPVVVNINPLWQEILFGSIFIFVIVFFPEGFVGLVARAARFARAWLLRSRPSIDATRPTVRNSPERTAEIARTFTKPATYFPAAVASGDLPTIALEARGISYSYVRGVKALDDVDFTVRRGTIHGLIGPNGSGKSTLVNLLSGAIAPDEGSITANGVQIEHRPASQRAGFGMARTFQTAVMVKELPARANVTIGLYSRFRRIGLRSLAWPTIPSARRDSAAMAVAATEALADLGLGAPWASARVADVPHGVEQLTQLAAACVAQPSILILDEPLAGLSSGEVDEVSVILGELKILGVTIVVVEHQTRFIFEVCDDVTVLAAGELVKTGSAREVRGDDRVREVYLGE